MNHLPLIEERLEYSSSRIARLLGLSQDTVTRLCESGALKARRVPPRGHWRIDYESAVDYKLKNKL
jgi:excisionase family DNA binding protein